MEPGDKEDWKVWLPAMCHAYNSTTHSTTGFSPYYLLFGRGPRLAVDVRFGTKKNSGTTWEPHSVFLAKTKKRMEWAFRQSEAWHKRRGERAKKNYDRRSKGVRLKEGDVVLVKRSAFDGRHKLQDRWQAPKYVVTEVPWKDGPVYKIKRVDGEGKEQTLHRNKLLPLGCLDRESRIPIIGQTAPEQSVQKDTEERNEDRTVDQGSQQTGSVATPRREDAAIRRHRQTDLVPVVQLEKGDVLRPTELLHQKHPRLNVTGPPNVSNSKQKDRQKDRRKCAPAQRVPDLKDDGKKRELLKHSGKPEQRGMRRYKEFERENNKRKRMVGSPIKCRPEYQAEQARLMKERDKQRAIDEAKNPPERKKVTFEYLAETGEKSSPARLPQSPYAQIFDWNDNRRRPLPRKAKDGVKRYNMIWVHGKSMTTGKWTAIPALSPVPEVPPWWKDPFPYWRWRLQVEKQEQSETFRGN
jgi:hypothetical protein